jgi:sterol desaturase/sphingolipid hydroxylase (fatty acid hydroxylase superfamily)
MEDLEEKVIRPKHSGTKKVFENPILERLSRTHISVPITIFLLTGAALLLYAVKYTNLSIYLIPVLFFAGLIFFSFIEYIVHRYLFHMNTNTALKKRLQYSMHGIHHEYPKDKTRLAMPPILSVLLCLILLVIFYSLMNTFVFAFLPGMLYGYSGYLFVHFIVHAYPPPKNIFKALWIHHSIHHYKSVHRAFGVSSPLWDYVFHTMPE